MPRQYLFPDGAQFGSDNVVLHARATRHTVTEFSGPLSIVSRLQTLAKRCRAELQPSGFEEDFLLLSKRLLLFYEQIREQIERVPAVKAGTREELFRRLERGREFIHGHADGPLSLDSVAKAACLSQYHFHRVFTQVFEKTPHAYVTQIRLARAHSLIRSGMPVTQACVDVGFSSTTSFTRLFRAQYGTVPSKIRSGAK